MSERARRKLSPAGFYLHARSIHVVLARPEPALIAALEQYELMERIDPDHIYSDLDVAIAGFDGTS